MYITLQGISRWAAIGIMSSMFIFTPGENDQKEGLQILGDAKKCSDFWNIIMSTILAKKIQTIQNWSSTINVFGYLAKFIQFWNKIDWAMHFTRNHVKNRKSVGAILVVLILTLSA